MPDPIPAPPGRRERKRAQTLDHLARTAYRLFESHGFDNVTMEQIAAEADVAKGTLYNHFPIKEAVLAHWIHGELGADLAPLLAGVDPQAGFAAAVSHLLDASADWCEQHRVYLSPYLRFRFMDIATAPSGEDGAGASDLIQAFGFFIGAGQRAGELRSDIAASHLAELFHHLYFGALMRWLAVPGLALREEFAVATKLFVEGAATHPNPNSRSRKKS